MTSLSKPARRSRSVMHRLAGLLAVAIATASLSSPAAGIAGFGDVRADDYWADAVQWMVDNDITTGTGVGCFSPDAAVTRGQAAAFMWRMEGEPAPTGGNPFIDVVAEWQVDAVSWMVEQGITNGTSPWQYSPGDPLTRGQLAALLHRLAGEPSAAGHPFVDVASGWQQTPVSWMVDEGITTGTSATTFSPNAVVTRGQLATFFHRYKGSPAVTVDPASPACVGGPYTPPTTTTTTTTTTTPGTPPPGPGTPPADCTVRADEPWSSVWFDIYYNAGSSSCVRPEFEGSGSTFIVDRNNPAASDGNPGTAAAPWKTVVHAAETARSGDIVYVRAGTYNDGRIEPRASGVVFSAFPGEERQAVIEGWGIRAIGASDIIIHGFAFEDIANNGVQAMGPGVDNVVIANNSTVRTDYSGVSIRGQLPSANPFDPQGIRDVLIIGNDVRLANLVSSENISVGSGVVNVQVVANEVSEGDPGGTGGDEGIAFKNGVRDSKIYGNIVHDLSDRGIHIDGGESGWDALITNIEIYDNLIYNNANQGLWVVTEGEGDVDGVYIHDNIAYGNAADGFSVYDHPDGRALGGTVKNVVFENNTAFDNGVHSGFGGFSQDHPTATGIVFRNNISWGNTGPDIEIEANTTIEFNLCREAFCEVQADPLFVNAPTDLRVSSGSPAIGAASDGGLLGIR
jgi:S-layer homology domain